MTEPKSAFPDMTNDMTGVELLNESIHGHNVLKLIKSQSTPLTREQQLKALNEHFGETAQYHTCSLQELTAEQLLSLFIEKGKLAMDDNKINFVGCQCSH